MSSNCYPIIGGSKCCVGKQGPPGPQGPSGVVGIALYTKLTEFPNDNVGVEPYLTFNPRSFAVDNEVVNTVPADIVLTTVNVSGLTGGSYWTLQPGTYIVDYEMSTLEASSIGLYVGATYDALTLDPQSVAGAITPTTWIHGRIPVIADAPLVVAVGSVLRPTTVALAGNYPSPVFRVNFEKLA